LSVLLHFVNATPEVVDSIAYGRMFGHDV
jgi:hypothetical protein